MDKTESMFLSEIPTDRPDNITGQKYRFQLCEDLSHNFMKQINFIANTYTLLARKEKIMIDIKFLRENPDIVKENIKKKFQNHKLHLVDEVIDFDSKKRAVNLKGDELRSKRNSLSSEIGI